MRSSSTTRPDGPLNTQGSIVEKPKKKKLPPSAPYIAFGAAWAVYAVTFNFYRIWHVIPAALFSLVIGFVLHACPINRRNSLNLFLLKSAFRIRPQNLTKWLNSCASQEAP